MALTKEKVKQFQIEYKDENVLRETISDLTKRGTKLKKAETELWWDLQTYRLNYCKYGGPAFIKPKPIVVVEEEPKKH